MTRVCLHMIVRDEAPVIERCLASVLPYIDTWCVVDTGSTDGTQDIVKHVLRNVPGRLYERPWRNFGHNRTEAMTLAREQCILAGHGSGLEPWMLLTIDADEELIVPEGWTFPQSLQGDAYEIEIRPDPPAGCTFTRHLVTRASIPWRYEGAIHEDIACDVPARRGGIIPDIHVLTRRDGHRETDPDKYLRDAEVLRTQMSRQQYYLAQSLWDHYVRTRDRNALEEAAKEYERRALMPGWDQETWYASFAHARCLELLGRPPKDVVEAYLVAYSMRPSRAETLTNLARYCRGIGQPNLAGLYQAMAQTIPPTTDSMYVDASAYSALTDTRIGIITAPRKQGTIQALDFTLVSVLVSDRIDPASLRVFSDSTEPPPCSVPVECEAAEELARRKELGGIYGTLNLARALDWASGARDISVTLEDDVLCSRGWLRRGTALLEAAEAKLQCEVVLSLHDMHGIDAFDQTEVLRVGDDRLMGPTERTYPNGSQGYLMRPRTATTLARELRWRMDLPEVDQRKLWAMDCGMTRLCALPRMSGYEIQMLHTDPTLLCHIDGAVSTWATGPGGIVKTDDEHRSMRKTRRFRPW